MWGNHCRIWTGGVLGVMAATQNSHFACLPHLSQLLTRPTQDLHINHLAGKKKKKAWPLPDLKTVYLRTFFLLYIIYIFQFLKTVRCKKEQGKITYFQVLTQSKEWASMSPVLEWSKSNIIISKINMQKYLVTKIENTRERKLETARTQTPLWLQKKCSPANTLTLACSDHLWTSELQMEGDNFTLC